MVLNDGRYYISCKKYINSLRIAGIVFFLRVKLPLASAAEGFQTVHCEK